MLLYEYIILLKKRPVHSSVTSVNCWDIYAQVLNAVIYSIDTLMINTHCENPYNYFLPRNC